MSQNQAPSDPSQRARAFRQAQLPGMLKSLDEQKQKLQTEQSKFETAQADLISSIAPDERAYPHLVKIFGGDLSQPRLDTTSIDCIESMFELIECIDESHGARKHLENLASAGSEIEYISGDISQLEAFIAEAHK